MELRPYQCQAVEAVYEFLRTRDDNQCVVIPTAGGKTPVMATICRDAVQLWSGRVLIGGQGARRSAPPASRDAASLRRRRGR